jgi:hypothetical protein
MQWTRKFIKRITSYIIVIKPVKWKVVSDTTQFFAISKGNIEPTKVAILELNQGMPFILNYLHYSSDKILLRCHGSPLPSFRVKPGMTIPARNEAIKTWLD